MNDSEFDQVTTLEELSKQIASDVVSTSVLDLLLNQAVLSALLELIEDCNNQQRFTRFVKSKRPLFMAHFVTNYLEPNLRTYGVNELRPNEKRKLINEISKQQELSEEQINTMWTEVKSLDFNIFN